MKLGRNDPCHCGSGATYKHCCLVVAPIGAAAPAHLIWRRLHGLLGKHGARMHAFIDEAYGPAAWDEAWEEFAVDHDTGFDPEGPTMQLFMPWFAHSWSPDVDTEVTDESLLGVVPTAAYLARKGRQLDALLRGYLESCVRAPFTFYEVIDCEPGRGMNLRDILTDERREVAERAASRSMQRGDIVFGQLASVQRLTMLEGWNGFAISPLEKRAIVALRAQIESANPAITQDVLREYDLELRDLFHDIADRAFNPKLPELQNTDGEPLSLRKLIYDLETSPQEAFDALKHLAWDESAERMLTHAERDTDGSLARISFSWTKPGNAVQPGREDTSLGWITIDGARLTVEVDSEARADAAAQHIDASLGERASFRVTRVQSTQEMLAQAHAAARTGDHGEAEQGDLVDLPEVQAQLAEFVAAHWERWVDTSIPALDGRTPSDAVKDADGRDIVASLVIQAERDGRRMKPPVDPLVFRRLRERLGLSVGH